MQVPREDNMAHNGHMADAEVVHPKSSAMPPEDVALEP